MVVNTFEETKKKTAIELQIPWKQVKKRSGESQAKTIVIEEPHAR